MRTLITKSIKRSAEIIRNGGLVAFPTETVYGLGANIFNENAIRNIFKAKGRPSDNPLIAHIGELAQIKDLATEITPHAHRFIDAFFPAPLTLVLPKSKNVPYVATARLETIGIRMPENKLAQEFLRECRTPLVAPSANLSGKPSPTNWQAVYEDLDGKIDCILQGEVSEIGLESTVIDCTGEIPLILRSGAITLEQLREIIPETIIYKVSQDERPKSPGLKHKHYSPKAIVKLIPYSRFKIQDSRFKIQDSRFKIQDSRFKIQDSRFKIQDLEKAAFIGLSEVEPEFLLTKTCESVEDYAHSVFRFFRECDKLNIKIIYCEKVEEKGIGVALMDRLRRATED